MGKLGNRFAACAGRLSRSMAPALWLLETGEKYAPVPPRQRKRLARGHDLFGPFCRARDEKARQRHAGIGRSPGEQRLQLCGNAKVDAFVALGGGNRHMSASGGIVAYVRNMYGAVPRSRSGVAWLGL